MSNGARAATVSVAALAGFLVVAGLQLALALLALWAVLWLLPSEVALRAGVPLSIATVGALGYATWRALHTRRRVPAGVAVTRDRAPKLWSLVDGAAAAAGVPPPEALTVVADATATLGENTRLLGLIGGRRELYLGLPLLQAWDPDRVRAAVTHELAHGSPQLGRWAPLAYRGRVAVGRTVPRISRRNLAGAVLRAYAGWYRKVDAPFSRAQELAADRIAAGHAGAGPAVAVLRDLPALAGMQRLFHAEYLGPGWQSGYVPDDVFGGLLRVLAARSAEMTLLRVQEPEPSGPWDTHPTVAERVAAIPAEAVAPTEPPTETERSASKPTENEPTANEPTENEPTGNEPTGIEPRGNGSTGTEPTGAESTGTEASGSKPAANESTGGELSGGELSGGQLRGSDAVGRAPAEADELVPDLPRLGRALQDVAFPPRGRTVVGWDECLSVARTAEMEREAEAALATISRAAGIAVPGPAAVLDLAADGRLRAAAGTLFPGEPAEKTTERIIELLGLMLALAALRSGVVRWRHSWTGAAEVVGVNGSYLNLAELAQAAADPGIVPEVREYLERIGVDPAAPAANGGPARSPVLGGLVNLSADGERTDLLITDLGLLLVPGLPRGRVPEARRRLAQLAADGVPEPQAAGRFVPFADVAAVTTLPGRRKGWVLGLRDGGEVTLRPALDADELPGGWAAWDEAVAFLAGTR